MHSLWALPILILEWLQREASHRLSEPLLTDETANLEHLLATHQLLTSLLANKVDDVQRLLAQQVQLRGSIWPGNFTALHAAALSDCWRALPALLAATAKQGLSIDCRLNTVELDKVFSELLFKLGTAEANPVGGILEIANKCELAAIAGITPLHLACRVGSLRVIPILLAHGASAAPIPYKAFLNDRAVFSTRDALTELLTGRDSSLEAATLLPIVELLLKHGAYPLACKTCRGWRIYNIVDQETPREIRCCLVSCLRKRHQQGRFQLLRPAFQLLVMYGAALCGDGDALLYFLRHGMQDMSYLAWVSDSSLRAPIPPPGIFPGNSFTLVDIIEAAPPALATTFLQELLATKQVDPRALLRSAAFQLHPQAVRALLYHNEGPLAHNDAIILANPWEPKLPGAFLASQVMHCVTRRPRLPVLLSTFEARAVAVLALLTEAGFKPSFIPVGRVTLPLEGVVPSTQGQMIQSYVASSEQPLIHQRLPRRVLLALQRPTWSAANHRNFPPAFQLTARAFLLAAASQSQQHKRHEQEKGAQLAVANCCLGDLPVPLLERVLGLAAYPLSAWL